MIDKLLKKMLKNSKLIIDLGAAPGGWLQIALERAKQAKIIAIDLQEIEPLQGVDILCGDFTEDVIKQQLAEKFAGKKADFIMSDMAPASCGHQQTDHLRIVDLAEQALAFAVENLAQDGNFVCKLLKGGGDNELISQIKSHFSKFKIFKPDSSRKSSSEVFLVAQNFKSNSDI